MKAAIISREYPVDLGRKNNIPFKKNEQCICKKGEVLPFQILVEETQAVINGVTWQDFSDGKGNTISGKSGCVINLQVRDDLGNMRFHKKKVKGQAVLWAYIEIPEDIPQGAYEGTLRIICDEGAGCDVVCRILVTEETAENFGYNSINGLSRIKWFQSDIGIETAVPSPFIPVGWEAHTRTVKILGRKLILGEFGFPKTISAFFDSQNLLCDKEKKILEEPVKPQVQIHREPVSFVKRSEISKAQEDCLTLQQCFDSASISMSIQTEIEFDGYCAFDMALTAKEDCTVDDVVIDTALCRETAKYFVGLGQEGGRLKEPVDFKWDGKNHHDSFWIGDINGGLRIQLKDDTYQKPNINIYYGYKPLKDSNWSNKGKGGIHISKEGSIRMYSGEHRLKQGQTLHFIAVMMITPFKEIDYKKHFEERYYQSYTERTKEQWSERAQHDGVNVINIHHGSDLNPYINYPFFEVKKLKEFTNAMHQKDIRVKLYYTIREITTKIKEYPIIRSMDYEILEPSKGVQGATLWQQDAKKWVCAQYGDDIIPAWRETITAGAYQGEQDASLLTNGQSPLCNYYVEGLLWLMEHCGIDGIYIDDLSYDRNTMKRVRRILNRKAGAMIDMHSWNHYNERAGMTNSLNLYSELLPYIDRLWLGEGFDYENTDPDYWMVEMSGIPYGLMADMLQNGGNFYRGLIFGETVRHGWSGDAKNVWKLWDDFKITESTMTGYWNEENPVVTDCAQVYTTCYRNDSRIMICIASWAAQDMQIKLILRKQLEVLHLWAPEIAMRQEEKEYLMTDSFKIGKNSGLVLIAQIRE